MDSAEPPDPLCHNYTSAGNSSLTSELAELRVLIPGTIVFFLTLPFVLFHFRFFPIGTTPAVLVGALLMVASQVVTQDESYTVMGHRDNLTAIYLLLGTMLLAQYIEREQLLVKVLRLFLKQNHSFPNYIWRICLLTFVLSAFFSNDACCAIFTPLILKFWESQERPRTELETILLAVATSANIGSIATVFGNPQMAFLSAKTSAPEYLDSRLDMLTCVTYLLPVSLIICSINVLFLIGHHKLKTRHVERSKLISEASQSEQEMAGLASSHSNGLNNPMLSYEGLTTYSQDRLAIPSSLETIKEDEVLEIPENRGIDIEAQERELVLHSSSDSDSDNESETKNTAEDLTQISSISYKPSQLAHVIDDRDEEHNHYSSNSSLNRVLEGYSLQLSHRIGIYKSVSAVSASEFLPIETGLNQLSPSESSLSLFSPGESIIFQVFLLLIICSVTGLFLASTHHATFDLGLVPIGAVVICVVADAILNRRSGLPVIKRVDWSIILLFMGLFVWIRGFNNTKLPHWIWHHIGLDDGPNVSAQQLVVLTCFIVVASNLLSNVPLALILLDLLQPCSAQRGLVIYIAFASTLAGNLTLFGSVANLIVVQKGVQAVNYRLSFWQYFLFGFPTTVILTAVGVIILSGVLLIPI